MKENPTLNDINESILAGSVSLKRYTFLEPISIAHLAIACKKYNGLINLQECTGNAASYLSRLNFYNYIGLNDPFGNNIYIGNNKNTIEVNEAASFNEAIFDKVKTVLKDEPPENKETIDRLLAELIANVEMYAEFGVVVGQVISRVFHLAIVDRGPGIVSHLKNNVPAYAKMSNSDVLIESLKKGVTSGRGKGFGLWQTYEVLKKNRGELLIRTENQILNGITGDCYAAKIPWVGTSIELRYNLDKPVSFSDIITLQNIGGVSNEFGF